MVPHRPALPYKTYGQTVPLLVMEILSSKMFKRDGNIAIANFKRDGNIVIANFKRDGNAGLACLAVLVGIGIATDLQGDKNWQ